MGRRLSCLAGALTGYYVYGIASVAAFFPLELVGAVGACCCCCCCCCIAAVRLFLQVVLTRHDGGLYRSTGHSLRESGGVVMAICALKLLSLQFVRSTLAFVE